MSERSEQLPWSWYHRLPPLLGTAVLVLTATPWMRHDVDVPGVNGNLESSYTLWGLLATVTRSYFGLLVLGIILILLFVVTAMVPSGALPGRAVAAWLGAGAIVGILLNIDSGYGPAVGLVLALVLTVGCAVVLTVGAILDRGRRTLRA